MLVTRCHRYHLQLRARMQQAWCMPSLLSSAARMDAACLARDAIATVLGCMRGCSTLGTRCRRDDLGLHARMQHAWHEGHLDDLQLHARMQHAWHRVPSRRPWAARTDAACLARDAIATDLGCTHRCSMLGTICHRYYHQLHARMQHAWHEMPSISSSAARTDAAGLARDAIAIIVSCTHGCGRRGTRCRRDDDGLHARMQPDWYKVFSLYLWAALTDAAGVARGAIATILGCTQGCSMLGQRRQESKGRQRRHRRQRPWWQLQGQQTEFWPAVLSVRESCCQATLLGLAQGH